MQLMCVFEGYITFNYVLNNCKMIVLSNVLHGMLSSSNSSSMLCTSTQNIHTKYDEDENHEDEGDGDEDNEAMKHTRRTT